MTCLGTGSVVLTTLNPWCKQVNHPDSIHTTGTFYLKGALHCTDEDVQNWPVPLISPTLYMWFIQSSRSRAQSQGHTVCWVLSSARLFITFFSGRLKAVSSDIFPALSFFFDADQLSSSMAFLSSVMTHPQVVSAVLSSHWCRGM